MLLAFPCKQGTLQITEQGMLQVVAPFNRLIWQVPCQAVTGFTTELGAIMGSITIHTAHGSYLVETVATRNFQKLQALFPELPVDARQRPAGREWYHSLTALTHVATYTNTKQMQKEVEAAAQFGWIPQGTAAQNGKFNVGKALAGGVVLGPIGLLAGAVGNKDKITITFTRTPEWLAQHQQHR